MDTKLTLHDLHVFREFVRPGEVVEVRIPKISGTWKGKYYRGTVAGYFDDHEAFCKEVREADSLNHGGIYFTLQVIDPRLLARSFNRLKSTEVTTADKDVLCYRWLPVDIDPVRPAGISSSDSELEEAMKMRNVVRNYLVDTLQFPKPIMGMSGNGGHILLRLPDLPANADSQKFIKYFLNDLAQRFNTELVKIDISVSNPARIWKLYGTTSRKGDAVPIGPMRAARPHRMAYIDNLGE